MQFVDSLGEMNHKREGVENVDCYTFKAPSFILPFLFAMYDQWSNVLLAIGLPVSGGGKGERGKLFCVTDKKVGEIKWNLS